jgi:amidophosphoribosyltransferase
MENKNDIKENIKRKFSVIKEIVKNKNVLLVDDSIVRGNTSKGIINLLKESGVNKIYFASAAPKILNSNNYGIYIENKEELITYKHRSNNQISDYLQIEDIYFNDLDKITAMINTLNKKIVNFEVSMFID